MKVYNINFDCGRITYSEYNSLVQVYKFHSFYDICEIVFSSSLPADDILAKVIVKEKIIPILDCYVQMLLDTFIVSMDFTENDFLYFRGKLFSYKFISCEVEKIVKNKDFNCQCYFFESEE